MSLAPAVGHGINSPFASIIHLIQCVPELPFTVNSAVLLNGFPLGAFQLNNK